jgi:colicin import membrane protein
MSKDNAYKRSLILAIILHVILFCLLFIEFTIHHNYATTNEPQINIVKAVTIDQKLVEKQIARIKREQQQKQEQEQTRIRQLKEQALAAKKAREQEQQRLVKLQAKAKKRQEEEIQRKKMLALKAKKEQEQQRQAEIQKAMQQQIEAEQKQMAAEAKQTQGEIDKYKALIIAAISQHWIVPQDVADNIYCQLLVHVAPGGDVLNIDLVKSSGNDVLDRSARTAVLKASPLPVPKDLTLFNNFRLLKLTVRPEGIT